MGGYRIEPESSDASGVLSVVLDGNAEIGWILELLVELNRRAARRILIDESELRPGLIGPVDIGKIADAWRAAPDLRSAHIAVVAPNLVVFGLNRMFQGIADREDRVSVFRVRDDALRWLLGRA
jgi:hypothetical protein